MWSLFDKLKKWYLRFERPISSAGLVGGFIFDIFTLRRIDLFWENMWIAAHFVLVALFLLAINLLENKRAKNIIEPEAKQTVWHFWLIFGSQFFFGGLLSAFLVFYFRSGTWSVTWPFLLLLALAFVANESLKRHYTRLVFQVSLLYLCLLSFAIFIVPVILNQIGPWIFVLSVALSIIPLGLFIMCLRIFARETFKKSKWLMRGAVIGIIIVVSILYFSNLIPPLPLSIVDGGIYHSLVRTAGGYVVTTENKTWSDYFSSSQTFHQRAGEPVYAHTAIFAPPSFNLTIIHEWQQFDPQSRKWITLSKIPLSIVGGRAEGFNTYSMQYTLSPGTWRVNVKTQNGQIIGRLNFTVVRSTDVTPLVTKIL